MITITHTHADGTLIEGSAKGDGVYEILKGLRDNWRYFPSLRQIGIGQSRDKAARTWVIGRAAEALRKAGHEVAVEIDDSERRSFAEAEAERNERAGDRAERLAGYADGARARSRAGFDRAQQIADMIPMGQPVLVGHHSERRHRRDLDRMDAGMAAGVQESRKAEYYERRAESAGNYQQHRESVPVTLRRIAKLEAEERSWQRALDGKRDSRSLLTDEDGYKPAEGAYKARVETELASIREQLSYWRAVVANAEASGVKVWGKADFRKGDFARVRGLWYEIERVNAKSVSVPHGTNDHLLAVVTRALVTHAMGPSQWTGTVPYDKVTGRKSAEEMAAILTEADCRLNKEQN